MPKFLRILIFSSAVFFILFPSLVSPARLESHFSPTRKIALTFDDGPKPDSTIKLMRVLEQHGVVGTFFIVGVMGEKYPEMVKLLHNHGHEIANHSWTHPDISRISSVELKDELDRTRGLIQKLTGQNTYLFRTPGSTDGYLRKHFQIPKPYSLVLWNLHSLDHEGRPSSEITDRVIRDVNDGDIVLLHNGLSSTVQSLHEIIPQLKRRGYQFVTVSQMMDLQPYRLLKSKTPTIIKG